MKTIDLATGSRDVDEILEEARRDDVIVRSADGSEFLLSAVDEFDREIALTRRSEKVMALLDSRARQVTTIPLDEAKRQLDLMD